MTGIRCIDLGLDVGSSDNHSLVVYFSCLAEFHGLFVLRGSERMLQHCFLVLIHSFLKFVVEETFTMGIRTYKNINYIIIVII